ncbi:hypothetical protein TNCV_3718411 [Trichonephila clavipes]|nr:hypothetical protein TNCV_3718411 [Trichonephila clavipes]
MSKTSNTALKDMSEITEETCQELIISAPGRHNALYLSGVKLANHGPHSARNCVARQRHITSNDAKPYNEFHLAGASKPKSQWNNIYVLHNHTT